MPAAASSTLSAHRPPLARTLPSYEPPSRGPARRRYAEQLALPIRVDRVEIWLPPPPPPDTPPQPSADELRRLLAALVEVADGRRPIDRLRRRLSSTLYGRLRQRPPTPLGRRFAVLRLHVDEPQAGVLEVCATVEVLPQGQPFTAVGRLQANWHGWTFTEFAVVLPGEISHRPLAA